MGSYFLSLFEEDYPSELGPLLVIPLLMLHLLESLILFLDYINDCREQYQRVVRSQVPLPQIPCLQSDF